MHCCCRWTDCVCEYDRVVENGLVLTPILLHGEFIRYTVLFQSRETCLNRNDTKHSNSKIIYCSSKQVGVPSYIKFEAPFNASNFI